MGKDIKKARSPTLIGSFYRAPKSDLAHLQGMIQGAQRLTKE